MDVTEFIKARLDEDEAAAKDASVTAPPPWKTAEGEWDSYAVSAADGTPVIYNEGSPSPMEAEHIARHDPARVLREVAAKRTVLRADAEPGLDAYSPDYYFGLSVAIYAMAAVWSDHPDYDQEWAAKS